MQLNKVIALTAICLVSLAFCPGISSRVRQDLIVCGLAHVVAHVVYSAIKYYGSSNIPYITKFIKMPVELKSDDTKVRGKGIKKFSVVMGVFAELVLFATWFNLITSVMIAGSSIIGLSIIHFYSMEVDQKLVLQVRPFALLVFPLALVGFVNAFLIHINSIIQRCFVFGKSGIIILFGNFKNFHLISVNCH